MPACENLPQELIVAIVDNIRDDKKSLETFSLVCKAWTNPARDRLFASLAILDVDDDLDKIKAANIASTYTPFLRHLHLRSWDNHRTFWHEVVPFLADFRTPRLRSLSLCYLAWHDLSPDERSALLRRFDSIVSLRLSLHKQDTSTIICSFPRLRNLTLTPSFDKCASPGPSPLSPELRLPERLSTLHILYFYQDYRLFLEWLGSIPEQLSIHTVRVTLRCLSPHDLDNVNTFLKASGPSLEVFDCSSDGAFIRSVPVADSFYTSRL
jgi:hypothetical protein